MDVIKSNFNSKKIKIFLVFFVVCLLISCQKKVQLITVQVAYQDEKAIGISFQSHQSTEDYYLTLDNNTAEILGEFSSEKGLIKFTPVIPFTKGQTYWLNSKQESIASFTIASTDHHNKPRLLSMYPSCDTVPENMLKMYFLFSQPMQEVRSSLDFIKVYQLPDHKEVDVFLELDPELWNKDHTVLTLWLDPGRIKTGLIPNLKKGLPIIRGNHYKITLDADWKDASGIQLGQNHSKIFYVASRDTVKPSVDLWDLKIPEKESLKALDINFKESLDAILLQETVRITDSNKNTVEGQISLNIDETGIEFNPISEWKSGNYTIHVESHLEDLAGNNLRHIFDVDLNKEDDSLKSLPKQTLKFKIL